MHFNANISVKHPYDANYGTIEQIPSLYLRQLGFQKYIAS